jgi:hypothetical protein
MSQFKNLILYPLIGAASIAAAAFFWNHLAEAQEKHKQQESIEQLTRSNSELLKKLSERQIAEDAKIEKVRELCLARQLTDRETCAEAGVELP